MTLPSRSQVTKAGKTIRDCNDPDVFLAAVDVVDVWRRGHATPLQKATMGLRSRTATIGCEDAEISQRLKRLPTIIDKLQREPHMSLGRMGDIGGCRAVLPNIATVRAVQRRYETGRRPPRRRKDYIAEPRDSGYRAVHLNIEYDGLLIEVQLRTTTMHQWAVAVESFGTLTRSDIKSGVGPAPVQDWLRLISQAMAIEEEGGTVTIDLATDIQLLRDQAMPYLRGSQ